MTGGRVSRPISRLQCLSLLLALIIAAPVGAQRINPYAAEGISRDLGRTHSLKALEAEADARAKTASTAFDYATVAELYKRLGNRLARTYYERAIAADTREPAWELFYAEYLRLSRGAGQQPLFAAAERHLFAAFRKLEALQHDRASEEEWDLETLDRARRARAALYERDGFQLVSAGREEEGASVPTRLPKMFVSPMVRLARSVADLDQSSDVRLLTSAGLFSEHLGHRFTLDEERELAHAVIPREAVGRLRLRSGAAPVVDVTWRGRETPQLQVTDFHHPTQFNDFTLFGVGVAVEQPFTVGGTVDALLKGSFDRVTRQGLIETRPLANDHVNQITVGGALSAYAGPDRINVSYLHVDQRIDPEPADLPGRDRRFDGVTATYQIFRALPLPGRDFNTGTGRRFETRGIDLSAGVLRDRERFPAGAGSDVFIERLDRFVGIAAKGLGRVDLTVQPTWYSNRVTNNPTQANQQLRLAGNVLVRLLDEERTAGMPAERLLGMPIGSLHLVVPFHWDRPLEGPATFTSRRIGFELWTKLIAASGSGVAVLASGGFGYQRFSALAKDERLVHLQFGVGF